MICVIIHPDSTTNDLATTRPFKGVVSYKTGRAGAMAYLKHTSAPPDLDLEERIGGGAVLSAEGPCVIYVGRRKSPNDNKKPK